MRTGVVVALLAALLTAGCGGSDAETGDGQNDGGYVPCKGVTMTGPDGETVEPDPDHPACQE